MTSLREPSEFELVDFEGYVYGEPRSIRADHQGAAGRKGVTSMPLPL